MNEPYLRILVEAQKPFTDGRFHVCQLDAEDRDDRLSLRGRALDKATLSAVMGHLRQRLPGLPIDARAVMILARTPPLMLAVHTNLTGFQREPSWLSEQQSQVLLGTTAEILDVVDRWSFVRLSDGYLGWLYDAYLGQADATSPPATHLVSAPFTLVYTQPNYLAPILTRLFAGTFLVLGELQNGWAAVTLPGGQGFVDPLDLRSLDDVRPASTRREHMVLVDAMPYVGVPYLWGGTTVNGIDCSGFAQLLYRLAGQEIPRDADRQYLAGQPVEPPYAPGDLLFFGGAGDSRDVSHVGLSLGPSYDPDGWQMIHASRSRNGVAIDHVPAVDHLRERFVGARRLSIEAA